MKKKMTKGYVMNDDASVNSNLTAEFKSAEKIKWRLLLPFFHNQNRMYQYSGGKHNSPAMHMHP